MATSERIIKKILGWSIGICIVGPAVGVSGVVAVDHLLTRQVCGRFASTPPAEQLRWLQKAGTKRDRRFVEVVRTTLQSSSDRVLLEAAGYAAMRIDAVELLPLIQQRADEGPDDVQRAQLIISAARLSGRDIRLYDWLKLGVQSDEPWRRVGSTISLLHIGRPEAGPLLVKIVREGPAQTRSMAMHNLAWITRPIGQAVGQPMSWLDASPPPTDSASLDRIDQFWQKCVTANLFNDVIRRLTSQDPDWAEMGRLIHARDKVAKWLQ